MTDLLGLANLGSGVTIPGSIFTGAGTTPRPIPPGRVGSGVTGDVVCGEAGGVGVLAMAALAPDRIKQIIVADGAISIKRSMLFRPSVC